MPFVPRETMQPGQTPYAQAGEVQPMRNFAPQEQQQMGQDISQAGAVATRTGQNISYQVQGEVDNANVKAAETKFIQQSMDILHGDNGYLNTRGADALNGYDPAVTSISKAKQGIVDSLSNNIQKQMFQQVAQEHLATFGAQMGKHRATQRVEYTAGESLSRADSMRAMAMNTDIGSKDHDQYLNAGVAEITNAYQAKGFEANSAETAKAIRDYRTQITQDDVSRLMTDNKYDDAKSVLSEQIKAGNVDPDVADHLRASIQSNSERVDAINTADKIFAANKGTQATDLEAMLAKVDSQVKDPEQRDRVRSLVSSQFSQARSLEDAKYSDNYKDVVNYKYGNNGSLKGIDPQKWGMLDAKDRYELTKPEAQESDLNTWFGFVTQPDSLTVDNVRAAFSQGKLTKGDFRSLTEKAMTLQNKPDYVQEAGDISKRIDYFAFQSGLPVYNNLKTHDQKAQLGTLHYRIQNDIDRIKSQNKGKITPDEADAVIKRSLTQEVFSAPRSQWTAWLMGKTYDVPKMGFEVPGGATGVVKNKTDGKLHYTDGRQDLGVAE